MYICMNLKFILVMTILFDKSALPNLADVKCNDELLMNQFCINPHLAATLDENYSLNYSFLNEIVEIDGIVVRVGDIITSEKLINLQEVEDHISKYGFHVSSIYEI